MIKRLMDSHDQAIKKLTKDLEGVVEENKLLHEQVMFLIRAVNTLLVIANASVSKAIIEQDAIAHPIDKRSIH